MGSGTYRTVKKWARQEMAKRFGGGVDGIADNLNIPGVSDPAAPQLVGIPQGPGPQGPAAVGIQTPQYEGPTGFANAPMPEARAQVEQSTTPPPGGIVGPTGQPV